MHYLVNFKVLLPVRNYHMLARVLHQKHDLIGLPDSTTHTLSMKSIFQMVTPKSSPSIPSLYAQCHLECNQYIMLDIFFDYQKDPDVAVSYCNQVKIVDGIKVSHTPLKVESYTVNGRMAVLLGRSC